MIFNIIRRIVFLATGNHALTAELVTSRWPRFLSRVAGERVASRETSRVVWIWIAAVVISILCGRHDITRRPVRPLGPVAAHFIRFREKCNIRGNSLMHSWIPAIFRLL